MNKLNKVLIIDDDEVNNLFCKIVIEHLDIAEDVSYCMNGPEAFDYLEACDKKEFSAFPDLILLDINMPLMNGIEFLEQYHKKNYHQELPSKISILSSSDMQADMQAALKFEAVVDYIHKPLSEEALMRIMSKMGRAEGL
jgi:CheY-like chemotaxis protein